MKMRDVPMPAVERERLYDEFGTEVDDMTLEEFREAAKKRMDELLDFYNELGEKR